jgi:hypothetical protein
MSTYYLDVNHLKGDKGQNLCSHSEHNIDL